MFSDIAEIQDRKFKEKGDIQRLSIFKVTHLSEYNASDIKRMKRKTQWLMEMLYFLSRRTNELASEANLRLPFTRTYHYRLTHMQMPTS